MKYLYFNTKNPYKITTNSLEKKEISGVNYSKNGYKYKYYVYLNRVLHFGI